MRSGVSLLFVACAAGVALAFAGACSTFSEADSPSGADAATMGEAGGDVATAGEAGGDGGGDAGPAPLLDEGFENDAGTCGLLIARDGTLAQVAGGHAGTYACRVCSNVGLSFFSIRTSAPLVASATAGSAYTIEGWVRYESGDPALRISAAFVVDDRFETAPPASRPTWTRVTHLVTPDAGQAVTPLISGESGSTKGCFLVDEIVVRRVK